MKNLSNIAILSLSLMSGGQEEKISHSSTESIKKVIADPDSTSRPIVFEHKQVLDSASQKIIDTNFYAPLPSFFEEKDSDRQENLFQPTQQIIIRDTGKEINNNEPATTTTINKDKVSVKKSLSTEQCKLICNAQIQKTLDSIIHSTTEVNLDERYVRSELYKLLSKAFVIQDGPQWLELVFQWKNDDIKECSKDCIQKTKAHIKSQNKVFNKGFSLNWLKIQAFLSDDRLKQYIAENQKEAYNMMTNYGEIKYNGDQEQFKKDIYIMLDLSQ